MRKATRDTVMTFVRLEDVRDRLASADAGGAPASSRRSPKSSLDAAARATLEDLAKIADALEQAAGPFDGVPVSAAAEYLAVSAPTVRGWLQHGLLKSVPDRKPVEIDIESLRALGRLLAELRESGQDRDWLRSLVDLVHDRAAVRDEELQRGLDDLRAGRVQPA